MAEEKSAEFQYSLSQFQESIDGGNGRDCQKWRQLYAISPLPTISKDK